MAIKVTLVEAEDGVEVVFGDDVQVPCQAGTKAAASLEVGDRIFLRLAGEVEIASVEEI